jgi:hypothetical protein
VERTGARLGARGWEGGRAYWVVGCMLSLRYRRQVGATHELGTPCQTWVARRGLGLLDTRLQVPSGCT